MAHENHENHSARNIEKHAAGDAAAAKSENLQSARQYSTHELNSALDAAQKNTSVDNFLKRTNFTLTDAQKNNDDKPGKDNDSNSKKHDNPIKRNGDESKADSDKIFNDSDKTNHEIKDIAEKFKTAEKMDNKIDPKMSEQDRQTAKDLNFAIAFGDTSAAARALERFKGDPEGLRKFMDQYNKTLKDSGTGMVGRTDGEKVTFSNGNGQGVEISTSGSTSVREVNHHPNGLVTNGRYLHDESPSTAFGKMSSDARFAMKLQSIGEQMGGPIYYPELDKVNTH